MEVKSENGDLFVRKKCGLFDLSNDGMFEDMLLCGLTEQQACIKIGEAFIQPYKELCMKESPVNGETMHVGLHIYNFPKK